MTDKMLFHRSLPTRSRQMAKLISTRRWEAFFVGMLLIKITLKQVGIERRHGKLSFLDKTANEWPNWSQMTRSTVGLKRTSREINNKSTNDARELKGELPSFYCFEVQQMEIPRKFDREARPWKHFGCLRQSAELRLMTNANILETRRARDWILTSFAFLPITQ